MTVSDALRELHRFGVEVIVTSRDRLYVQVPLEPLPEEAEAAVRVVLAAAPATLRRLLEAPRA